jgi:hypothetical protein
VKGCACSGIGQTLAESTEEDLFLQKLKTLNAASLAKCSSKMKNSLLVVRYSQKYKKAVLLKLRTVQDFINLRKISKITL